MKLTLAELDALPEMGGISSRVEMRDGKRVNIPVMGKVFALYHGPDDPMLIEDSLGRVWMVGSANGIRYKLRRREYE